MTKRDTALPSIQIEPETKKQVRLKSVEEGVSIAALIRAFLRAWIRGDPGAKRIAEEAKKK